MMPIILRNPLAPEEKPHAPLTEEQLDQMHHEIERSLMPTYPKTTAEIDKGPIHIYVYELALDHARQYSPEELRINFALAAELLRCCVYMSDDHSHFGGTIEQTASLLDSSLFVTLLARMWAQNVMHALGEVFENTKLGLLEAAYQVELNAPSYIASISTGRY